MQIPVWGGLSHFYLLTKEAPEGPQSIKPMATAFGYMPELDGKVLLLKILHVLVAGHEEIKPGQKWKLLPCWLAFIGPEDGT